MRRFILLAVLLLVFAVPYARAANAGVDSVSPAALSSSASPQSVTITGHDFSPGATVTLLYTDILGYSTHPVDAVAGSPIVHDVTVVSPTKITMTVQYQPTATLNLIVSVSNPEPDSALAQAPLTITAAISDVTPIIFDIVSQPNTDYTTTTVKARVTPHSTAYLAFGGNVPHAFYGVTIEGVTSATDDDGDGIVAFRSVDYDPGWAVFFVIDSSGVKHSASARWSTPVADATLHDVSVELGPDGSMSRLVENGTTFPLVMWVRPGIGAWYAETADGGTDDADVKSLMNGHVNLLTTSFHVVGSAPSAPASFQPSDYVVLINADRTLWWSSVLPAPLTGTPGNGTIYATPGGAREGSPAVFYLERRGGAEGAISVDYHTANGTAVEGVNYVSSSGSVSFARGEFLKTVSIPTIGDGVYTDYLSFDVALVPHGTSVATGNSIKMFLTNVDAPPAISIADIRVSEGDAGIHTVNVPVTLSVRSGAAASVFWFASDGSHGLLQFAPGEISKSIPISITANTTPDPDRTITITLGSPTGATISRSSAVLTIVDDDSQALSVDDIRAEEQSETATFLVTMSRAVTTPVTVHYATFDGTATAPADYTATSGILTFAPGEIVKTVTVHVVHDQIADPDETFSLRLSDASGAAILKGTGVATILESDRLPQPVVLIDDIAVSEGNSGTTDATFNVRLSFASALPVIVAWKTENGSARDDSDYIAGIGTLTFAPGETSLPVTVKISGDTTAEPNETFHLAIIGTSNAVAGNGATCTIINDDGQQPPSRRRPSH